MIIEVVAIVICVLLALLVGFTIPAILEVKRTIAQASEFLRVTEKDISATLQEAELSLRSIRGITDNINRVTDDVTGVSTDISAVAQDLRQTTRHMEKLVRRVSGNFSSIRAAVSAALGVLIGNLKGGRQ